MQRLLDENVVTKELSACTKKIFCIMIFKLFSLCKRYLTCTILMPRILNAMIELSHRKRIDYIISHISEVGKNTFM